MNPNHHRAHAELVGRCLVRLSECGILAWPQRVAVARPIMSQRVMRFGTPGMADILGVIPPTGRLLALEIKTGSGRQTQEQRDWQAAVERHGGLYLVVRDLADLDRLCVDDP